MTADRTHCANRTGGEFRRGELRYASGIQVWWFLTYSFSTNKRGRLVFGQAATAPKMVVRDD